jgi:hypothetical protein
LSNRLPAASVSNTLDSLDKVLEAKDDEATANSVIDRVVGLDPATALDSVRQATIIHDAQLLLGSKERACNALMPLRETAGRTRLKASTDQRLANCSS